MSNSGESESQGDGPLKIIVLVKEVPDTYGDRRLVAETGLADRAASEAVLDEIGERALEVALAYRDAHADTEVVLMSMAPESAATNLRKGLALGAASLVHIADETLAGADLGLTAEVLAAAVTETGYDLVITGNLSTDGLGGVLPAMIAERLGVALAGSLSSIEISESGVTGVRLTDAGTLDLAVSLPAVAAITESMPGARYPNFTGILAAKRKPVTRLTARELGVDPDDQSVPRSIVLSVVERAPCTAGTRIVDEGDAGQQLADYLIRNKLA